MPVRQHPYIETAPRSLSYSSVDYCCCVVCHCVGNPSVYINVDIRSICEISVVEWMCIFTVWHVPYWCKYPVNLFMSIEIPFRRAEIEELMNSLRPPEVTLQSMFQILAAPNNPIWHDWSGPLLLQVAVCCHMTPRHYLNQCWLVGSWTLRKKL